MDQILSDLHVLVLRLKTIQPIIFYNAIKTLIVPELLTEDNQFQLLSMIFLALRSSVKYRYNQL